MELDTQITGQNLRTGVLICDCGGEISGRIDTKQLMSRVKEFPDVVFAVNDTFPCSRDGRDRLQSAIKDHKLERVLIAGCTPRTMEKLFRQTILAAGLNALCVDVTDIREQCVYVHEDQPEVAFEKAVDLLAMGISRLQTVHLPETLTTDIVQRVMIVGAGLEGSALAYALAHSGYEIALVSPTDDFSSPVRQLDETIRDMAREELRNVLSHPLIRAHPQTRVVEIEGHSGQYQVTLRREQKQQDIQCGAIVIVTPSLEDHSIVSLATMLHLTVSESGALEKTRKRLRPERYREDGIFILSSSYPSSDTSAGLFLVYRFSARISHFLEHKRFSVEVPVSMVDETLCTGCGNCVQYCPLKAIQLVKREGVLSLAEVDPFLCVGCGNCLVGCPVRAITIPGLEDQAILAQISTMLQPKPEESTSIQPGQKVVTFACEWGAYAAADLAGTHHLSYAPDIRLIRMNCSARFDPMHVLWAFLNGADGVILGACPPKECHYSDSNLRAQGRIQLLKEQLADRGIDPRRLHLAFLPGDDGPGFVKEVNRFIETLKEKVI